MFSNQSPINNNTQFLTQPSVCQLCHKMRIIDSINKSNAVSNLIPIIKKFIQCVSNL